MSKKNLYTILGVSREATVMEIKRAYREKARKYHPDVSSGDAVFLEVQEAYEVLSDPLKRQEYDSAESVRFVREPMAYARNLWQEKIAAIVQ